MSVIISPIITNLGLNVFTPMATGIEFTFTHVAVGTGTSAVTAAATTLENEIARFPIAGGGVVPLGKAVSINALITNHANANPQNYDITEFGFYGVDALNNTLLFAIYRTNTAIVSKVSGADISAPFVMGLAALPTNNMTVQIDTNASVALALLGQHVAANHPHTQYKRTLDNSERLKVADGQSNDDAASIGQLATETTNRISEDVRIESDRVNNDMALAISLAAEITNRIAGDNTVLAQLNNVIFGGISHDVFSGTGNTFTLQPNKTIRVILIGGGGGGGGAAYGGGATYENGDDGGDSIIYPQGDSLNFILKASGGLGGDGAYGGNGSTYAIGNSPLGREVEINNLYDVVILSYQNGLQGEAATTTPTINHPTVKKLAFTQRGRGGKGADSGLYEVAGSGSSGAFVEAILINKGTTPLILTIDCGAKGLGGASSVVSGDDGVDGICVVIHE